MNVDEVLAKMDALDANEEEIQYIIDENLRVISIPQLGVVLGVEGDKDINSAKFKMVRYYKGIDLSKFEIRINFANANGDLSYYTVKNPTVTDDTLTFEWLVGYLVTKYKGTVRFVVRMIITDSSTGEVQQAFDTTIGEARSLEGLLVDTPTDEKVYDIVAQLKADLTDHVNNLLETIPEDYNELTKKVEDNTSGISQLKEDIAFVSDERISPSMTNFVVDGRQLFNKDGKLINGYYNNGKFVERSDMGGHFIKIKGGSNICASGAFFYGATFDANRKLIKEYLYVADGSYITTEQNAVWLYVATSTQVLDQLVVSYGDDDGNPVGNYWDRTFYVDGKYIDGVTSHTIYKLPYIQNCRVKCNGGNDTVTAYYAGVDCKKTVNIIQCRWIWERGSNTGTLALIINPNGIRYIKDITASSLHLQVRNNQIKLDVLGVKYGNYYYQNIINKTLDTIMPLDNKTEHIVSLAAIGNECIVTLDGTEYKGTFIPDDKITSLNEILGQYATFEHFCQGKRASYAMPQITQFIVRANDEYIIDDDFQRQDGQLQNTPQGISYYLISTLSNRG